MAVGTIQRSVLTDIANAIRVQNGGTDTYLPSEMAAAVLALDGTKAGTPLQALAGTGTGVISDAVFDGIADAIRAQNGLTETYKPSEIAPAILALSWDVGVKMRAILLADGTLEFNYRDGRSSDVPGAVILDAWEVDPAGYSSASARPWDDVKLSVTRAVFDGDFSEGGLANASYLFHGFENLVEVEGFEELSGATSMNQMFVSCPSLETIWADGFTSSATSGSLMFSGCSRLVGGQGYVSEQMDNHNELNYGVDGVLTDPASDQREWFRCFLYADGELVLTAAAEPEAGRELVSSGRLCANARYNSVGHQPWYDHRHDVEAVEIAADMAAYDHVNTNYWFYGHQSITDVTGMGNLNGVREMQHTFNSCEGLTEIDLSGLDPSSLEDLAYTFGGCGSLVTIWADADWALPSSGVSGFQTFYQRASLVGGAGTICASSRAGYQYMRIDGVGAQGASLRNKGARGQVAPLLNHPSYNGLHYVRFKFQEASMFGVPTQEVVVIVEARGCGKYSKQLYNLIGTNDDEGEVIVGPRDGSVQASIFDERKFVDNQLSSEQKVIFIGNPKFARDYLYALDSLATDQFDEHGIHIRIGGKHASVSVDSGGVAKETYWSFLDYAASRGCEFPDLLSALRDSTLPVSEESDGDRSGKNKIGVFFGGIAKGARGVVGGASDKAMLLRKASAIEDQKFQFAIRLFYLDKLRAFVEG